jgi:endonuclease III related protein
MSGSSSYKCRRIVDILRSRYGQIAWWAGDTDEVMIGAVLTQQTRWENVKVALRRLKERGLCTIEAIYRARPEEIEEAVRSAGFFRVKTRRLSALAAHVMETYGGVENMRNVPTEELRDGLLTVNGIGEETADSILCYGFGRNCFVIDAYTERLCRCAGIDADRVALKEAFCNAMPEDCRRYQQSHAHIVEYAKERCVRRRCEECEIMRLRE